MRSWAKSYCACRRTQNAALLQPMRSNASAIVGEMPVRPFSSREKVCRVQPSSSAVSAICGLHIFRHWTNCARFQLEAQRALARRTSTGARPLSSVTLTSMLQGLRRPKSGGPTTRKNSTPTRARCVTNSRSPRRFSSRISRPCPTTTSRRSPKYPGPLDSAPGPAQTTKGILQNLPATPSPGKPQAVQVREGRPARESGEDSPTVSRS